MMLIDVATFCRRVESDLNGLVDELQELTGRYGDSERNAWLGSLPKVSVVLARPELERFHLHLGTPGGMALEYRLPASSSWCDVVLLGQGREKPSAVILELKDWQTKGDQPGPREGLVIHNGQLTLHPSDQVQGYAEYCRYFHSAVLDQNANVSGCVYFTSASSLDAYRGSPHDRLVQEYPVFSYDRDVDSSFPEYLTNHLHEPSKEFAAAFDAGYYKQDRSFVDQVSQSILNPETTVFVLLNEQREGFHFCMKQVDDFLAADEKNGKAIVIIQGPPGSGKSVLAAYLWAAIVHENRIPGNIVLTTTSGCQRSNWENLFQRFARRKGARGLVIPANKYNPGMTPVWTKKMRERGLKIEIETWKDNYNLFRADGGQSRAPDDMFAVSIVDEAHALIDPTAPGARGVSPSGHNMHAGPQAWHIIRCTSALSVFLLDGEQSYRDNETTTADRIKECAADHGIPEHRVLSLDLGDAQFRCGGSKEYVDWLENAIGIRTDSHPQFTWRRQGNAGAGKFSFEIVDSPHDLDDRLRNHIVGDRTVRLVAAYGRKWVTKNVVTPHTLPPEKMDFYIHTPENSNKPVWSRIWNYAPKQDYTKFIQAPPGTMMHEDPLCEVGCPYVVRGFDYDYLGVLWLNDLVWRNGNWVLQIDNIWESAWKKSASDAKKELKKKLHGPEYQKLLHRSQRAYRILLSRAIHGIYVWFEDQETKAYIESLLEGTLDNNK